MQPTKETLDLVKNWTHSLRDVKQCKAALNSAECSLLNAENALGKWLTPKDAAAGEVFMIWIGDGIVSITKTDENSFKCQWRQQPSACVAIEMNI